MRSYYHEIMGMEILPQYLSLKVGAYAHTYTHLYILNHIYTTLIELCTDHGRIHTYTQTDRQTHAHHKHTHANAHTNIHRPTCIQGAFRNNIAGYAKFPMTCFLDIYQNLRFSPRKFF